MQKRDYILARSFNQYIHYCNQNAINPKEHVYISDGKDIQGVDGRDKYLFCIGQWWLNPKSDNILSTAESRGFKIRLF